MDSAESPKKPFQSSIVVISWWSNCLALACLEALKRFTGGRKVFVVQVGKGEEQKELFRYYMTPGVVELSYPAGLSEADWQVRETVAQSLLRDETALWFVDHDLFLEESCEAWLEEMDVYFAQMGAAMAHPFRRAGGPVTCPLFWLSPRNLPADAPSFAREALGGLPDGEAKVSWQAAAPEVAVSQKGPFWWHGMSLRISAQQAETLAIPRKDTLVNLAEHLMQKGRVARFPIDQDGADLGLPLFPRHRHLGGLWALSLESVPEYLREWVRSCLEQFRAFYTGCPPEWRSVEDSALRKCLGV